jgi:hypothetical protein
MKTLFVFLAALGWLGCAPALGQTLLGRINQAIPMVAALDNPCTAQREVIVFEGMTQVQQTVWLMADGNLRLQVAEQTTMQGKDTAVLLGTSPTYGFSGSSNMDAESAAASVSILNYKKVSRSSGTDDNFHSILVIDFDPATLQLNLRIEGACNADLLLD